VGWQVRLHERSKELRVVGSGIWLWENGLRALEMLGAFERATYRAMAIREWRIADESGRIIMTRRTSRGDRFLLSLREDLYNSLIDRAMGLGVNIVTSSTVVRVKSEGILVTENGYEGRADLIVVADGAYSRLRSCIRSQPRIKLWDEGGIRMLIGTRPDDITDIVTEYWNGKLRLGYNPCTEGQNYIYLCAPTSDARAVKIPTDVVYWTEKFPRAANLIKRFGEAGRWDSFVSVRCRRWHDGRVALIGDAAHAMQPNLGQAANTAFVNALALAAALDRDKDVDRALQSWETEQRPLTEHVQRFSDAYGTVLQKWPSMFLPLRGPLMRRLCNTACFDVALNRGARKSPNGYGSYGGGARDHLC
jgi:2-polyprenyl-6-methoxyphenol hydroxylase-like FAD-dependent oxidoreductase